MISRVVKALGATTAVMGLLAAGAQAVGGPPPPAATNHATVQLVASGLSTPTSFAFGDGSVFEGDGGNQPTAPGGVFLLKNGTGTRLAGSPSFVAGLAWHKGSLYISSGNTGAHGAQTFRLLVWSHWNGTSFTERKVLYTAPKNFDGFNGLAFGANGRLYVGVDTSLNQTNDHGPVTRHTPYRYDILSFKANGRDRKVFATGIRQPWQLAFPKRSSVPFVSDLGQDEPTNLNPPDFLLRVHQGDNYGFPRCNWVHHNACRGFARPVKFFKAHVSPMGLAIIGNRLYISEFGGTDPGKADSSGRVVSMPLAGGNTTPVLTGFVAPIVGLAANGHELYVGELTGQVFRVRQ